MSTSSYYYKPKRDPIEKAKKDAMLRDLIEKIHVEFPTYGYRRIYWYLLLLGRRVNMKRIRRVMQVYGLYPIIWKSFRISTTDSNHSYRVYPNLLRKRTVTDINQVWVADITYVKILTCFIYVAVILDLYSRKAIGWAISKRIDHELCLEALHMALDTRKPPPGCIHHSDRGVQYSCDKYVDTLKGAGMQISMSRKANPYDNAFMESFIKTLKYDEVHLNDYITTEDVIRNLPRFIEKVYNTKRLHSSIGYRPPEQFEKELLTMDPKDRPILNL